MGYQNKYKYRYKYKITRNYPKAPYGCRQLNLIMILVTGLFGALIGGLLSAGVVISLFTNKLQTEPTLAGVNLSSYPVVDIAKKVGPSVVTICNYRSMIDRDSDFGNSNLSSSASNNLIQMGNGSGFIIDARQGYIVTNDHVIEGAQKLMVCLADGNHVEGSVVGADSKTDLAVVKINKSANLTAAALGDSSKIQVGEPVVVIGNPCGEEFAGTVTTGIVSATNRILQSESSFSLIQTDAAINPGNSGGPLLNYSGQVIGINSAKFSQNGIEGIGFAIPITDALPVIQQLIQQGYVSHR